MLSDLAYHKDGAKKICLQKKLNFYAKQSSLIETMQTKIALQKDKLSCQTI